MMRLPNSAYHMYEIRSQAARNVQQLPPLRPSIGTPTFWDVPICPQELEFYDSAAIFLNSLYSVTRICNHHGEASFRSFHVAQITG
jgi:hypothetical protein